MKKVATWWVAAVLLTGWADHAVAEEGLWLLDQLPVGRIRQMYGFEPDRRWIEHVQKSCVRFDEGGSGSFVSPRGLILTNHHVGWQAIYNLGDAEHDYIRDGFWAPTIRDELKCPGLSVRVLMKIRDITELVEAAVTPKMKPAEALGARRDAAADIQEQAAAETGLYPEVITLFGGARRKLYIYKQYEDVRLVMAPEREVAFFGGDNANFEYPRHSLDVCFFRAYEHDRPAKVEHWFAWATAGVSEGDPVFVAGHPHRTRRLLTVEHLKFLRDIDMLLRLRVCNMREVSLLQFMAQSDEHRRVALGDLLAVQNARKALDHQFAGLLDERMLRHRLHAEAALRKFISAEADRRAAYGMPWDKIGQAVHEARLFNAGYYLLEGQQSPFGQLFEMARDLVRMADECRKADPLRLPEYRRIELDEVRKRLGLPVPISRDLERLRLRNGLSALARTLGGDDPRVVLALAGFSPDARADQIIEGTRLDDVDYRGELLRRRSSAVDVSDDAMIRFARRMDGSARAARSQYEQKLLSVLEDAYIRLSKAMLEMHGEAIPPDATGSLRLSLGAVAGYGEKGRRIGASTTLSGTYELAARHAANECYSLPRRWLDCKEKLDLDTPFNFVSTNDIVGGNSGSAVLNRKAELVGVVFDGNLQSLVWDYHFDQQQGRAVSVDARAIVEVLRKVYGADRLVDELLANR